MGDKTSIEWTDATWLGVSCEDQPTADERIPRLLQTPAAVRFVSLEPLLGPIDIAPFLSRAPYPNVKMCPRCLYFTNRDEQRCPNDGVLLGPDIALDWVIVGGESGPHARPMHPDWVRSLRDQCTAAGIPFFFKQWGEWAPAESKDFNKGLRIESVEGKVECGYYCDERVGHVDHKAQAMVRVGRKAAGAVLDGRVWREFPGKFLGGIDES